MCSMKVVKHNGCDKQYVSGMSVPSSMMVCQCYMTMSHLMDIDTIYRHEPGERCGKKSSEKSAAKRAAKNPAKNAVKNAVKDSIAEKLLFKIYHNCFHCFSGPGLLLSAFSLHPLQKSKIRKSENQEMEPQK